MPENYAPTDPTTFYFDCPLCGSPLDVRLSKKDRPYVTCDACSLQLFVRGPAGIDRFNDLAHTEDRKATRAQVLPKRVSEPRRPRGRPRKIPEVTQRVELVASQSAFDVLARRAR